MPQLTNITVAGIAAKPSSIMFNGKPVTAYEYVQTVQVLYVTLAASMKENFKLVLS